MRRSAAVVSSVAVFAYFVAVSERSSMGVAAALASQRFEVSASELSILTVVQLIVYAGMQIPVGVLLDRYGSKRLIFVGALLMGVGQAIVANAAVLGLAVLGRGLVGMGDAFTFISMIRLINHWYSGPAATRRTQLYANIGQLGQVFSAVPFAFLLASVGWSNSYALLAAFALLSAALTMLFVLDSPNHAHDAPIRTPWRTVFGYLGANLRDPAVRMAFWTHFSTQSSGSVFVLLWGFTFLTKAENVPTDLAGGLLSSFVFIGFAVGPVLSHYCATRPSWRPWMVSTVVIVTAAIWLAVIAWPGRAPLALLLVLVLVLGVGGPASMMAFDYTRTMVTKEKLGTANGFANIGGFAATFTLMFLIGWILDLCHRSGLSKTLYGIDGFRYAMTAALAIPLAGLLMFHLERRKVQERRV